MKYQRCVLLLSCLACPYGVHAQERASSSPPSAADTGTEQSAPPDAAASHPPAALPASQGSGSPPASNEAELSRRPATMDEVAESSVQEVHFGHVTARYGFNFFGEVLFTLQSPGGGDLSPAFAIGAQDIVLHGELGEHMSATTEFAIEFGEDNQPGVDLERLSVGWQSEQFYVDAGRTHSDLGYWNTAYHHGRWLQLPIARPTWVRFEDEGGLLPVHWVGLTGGAKFALGDGALHLALAVGNGRGKVQDDIRNTFDYQASKALYGKLEYVGFGSLRELRIGFSGVYDRIAPQDATVRPALPDQAIHEWIGGFHIAYPSLPVLLIVEAYLIDHRASTQAWQTYGGFVLAGYAIGPFTPYAEINQILSSGGADPFFNPMGGGSVEQLDLIGGVRLDVSSWSALKLEYVYTHFPMAATRQTVTLDWSWGF
jgi:hypothetical protein